MPKYQYTYTFDYNTCDVSLSAEITLPQFFKHNNDKEASHAADELNVRFILLNDSAVIKYLNNEVVADKNTPWVKITKLKDGRRKTMGQPLSVDDITRLKKMGILEETLFSKEYILSEKDYEPIEFSPAHVYQSLCAVANHQNFGVSSGFNFEKIAYGVRIQE